MVSLVFVSDPKSDDIFKLSIVQTIFLKELESFLFLSRSESDEVFNISMIEGKL